MDAAEPIQLVYESEGCGTADAFRSQVLARTAKAAFVDAGAHRTFRVILRTSTGGKRTGKLVVTDPKGGTSERSLGAGSCDEMVEALALVTAIAIDPAASTRPIAELEPTWLAYPADEHGPTPLLPWDAGPPRPREAPPPPAPSARWQAVVVAHAGVLAGPLPSAVGHFGGGAGFLRDAGLFSQELRATVAGATGSAANAANATASFTAVRVDLSLAPLRPRWKLVAIAPVAAVSLLWVSVTPEGVVDPQPSARLVPLLGLGGRATLELRPMFVELEARLSVPLTHERYYVDPSVTVFESARVAFDGGLAVGVRFP